MLSIAKVHDSLLYRWRKVTYQKKVAKFLDQSQYWEKDKLEAFQLAQMKQLLAHASCHVPYYKRLFKKISFSPEKLRTLEEVKQIPLMDKATVRDNFTDLIATNVPKRLRAHFTTGGSTGEPLGFYFEKARSDLAERAFVLRSWSWAGYRHGYRMVQLKGRVVPRGKIYEFNKQENILYLSSYLMNEQNMSKYIDLIRDFDPLYFHVYPSTIELLAKYMKGNNVAPFAKVKAILCASENIYPFQRMLIEQVLNARVFGHYGLAEHVATASECEKCNQYHLIPEHSFNFLVDDKGQEVTRKGQSGEIVGTYFYNYVMPFINYRTGDIATLSSKDSCECGRHFRLLEKIDGRTVDLVRLSDGTKIPAYILICAQHFKALDHIIKIQMIQEQQGKIILRIVKDAEYTDVDEREIAVNILDSVNGKIKLYFEYVTNIQTTERGKHRLFVNKLHSDKKWDDSLF